MEFNNLDLNLFCSEFNNILNDSVNKKILQIDKLKNHIVDCKQCGEATKGITKNLINYVKQNPMLLMKVMK